jgi:tetratricopeptide (TPR) repeat protein
MHPLRLLTLSIALIACMAHADEYAEVSQLIRAGKLPEAAAKTDQHLAAKPKDPRMRFLKGVIQLDSGKTMDSISTFTRLTEDYPELPEPYNNLAVLYARQNQFDKARSTLEMAIRTNPSYAIAHENLGDVYAKLASEAYNKALQLDTINPAVTSKLTLIRELFNQNGSQNSRINTPSSTTQISPAVSAPSLVPTSIPAPVLAKTPLTLPGSIVAIAPAPTPVTPTTMGPVPLVPPQADHVVGTKPVAPSASLSQPQANSDNTSQVEAAVRAWAHAWAVKDMKGCLAAYRKESGPPDYQNSSTWEEERRLRITCKNKINVKLKNLVVTVNSDKAVAKFKQDYKADDLKVTSRKTLDLIKNGERWQIVKEFSGA